MFVPDVYTSGFFMYICLSLINFHKQSTDVSTSVFFMCINENH